MSRLDLLGRIGFAAKRRVHTPQLIVRKLREAGSLLAEENQRWKGSGLPWFEWTPCLRLRPHWKEVPLLKASPPDFRRDVVAVARTGEAPLSQITKDFGISESCLHRRLKIADVDDSIRPGTTSTESAEIRG